MKNRDEVVKCCAKAIECHANLALNDVLCATSEGERAFAESRLRDQLVALEAGHEAVAANGATFAQRRDLAARALQAWDS